MEFLYASANEFLVIMTLAYAEWTMLVECTKAVCARDFLLSTRFYTVATPCQYASGYTTCGVRDFGNSALHKMLLFSTYCPHLLSSTSLCPTQSLTKRGYLFTMTEHEKVLGERRLKEDSTLQSSAGLLKETACGCCFTFFGGEMP